MAQILVCVCVCVCVSMYVLYVIYLPAHTHTHTHTYRWRERATSSMSRRWTCTLSCLKIAISRIYEASHVICERISIDRCDPAPLHTYIYIMYKPTSPPFILVCKSNIS